VALGNCPNVIVASEFQDSNNGFDPGAAAFIERYAQGVNTAPTLKVPRFVAPMTVYPQLQDGTIFSDNPDALQRAVFSPFEFKADPSDDSQFKKQLNFRYSGQPVAGVGVVNVRAGEDGTFRRYQTLVAAPRTDAQGNESDALFPTLSVLAVQRLQMQPDGHVPPVVRSADGRTLTVGAYRIPIGPDGGFYLRFSAPTDAKGGIFRRSVSRPCGARTRF